MTTAERATVLTKVVEFVEAKHVDPANPRQDYRAWKAAVEAAKATLLPISDTDFEAGVQQLLAQLGTSHTGFFRQAAPGGAAPIFSLNASLGIVQDGGERKWMFQHVLEDGPASRAGLRPGELLVEVNGKLLTASNTPVFPLGEPQRLVLENVLSRERRRITVDLPKAAKEKGRPPMVIPKLVSSKMLDAKVGYIRGTYFQGTIGLDFIRAFSLAMKALSEAGAKAWVLDFRANPGGGLGSLRVMSWLTTDRTPVGYSLTRKMIEAARTKESLPCIDKLPMSKWDQAKMAFKYRVLNRDRSVALATEGLGHSVLQGRSVLLFDENSRSAAEMIAAFAQEHRLAPIVGVKTPGEVLGAVNFTLPFGYRLRMPIATWCTWNGATIEGKGVIPTSVVTLTPEALAERIDAQVEAARATAAAL